MTFAPDIEAVQLNKEAGEFFRCGQYGAAVQCYEAAIIADTSESPLYFSNLAAAFLKLGQFESAQSAAHTALQRDPKSVKARYRRALARRESGRIAEALMDLATLLSIHPDHKEGSFALQIFSLRMLPQAANGFLPMKLWPPMLRTHLDISSNLQIKTAVLFV
ncbi:hypothetical protein B0H14DRAFT_810833 [Mycena olivaceomarginata]|nr:hypothetical protein B0H14DRAFT_810833 [Mycena olivaceomarginata]